ncbi:hypothetical protein TNCV_3662941 [Trichonephila clavipes]|nr:hypothetical protein TNCV_3662941 [Trichonephila clavipes]
MLYNIVEDRKSLEVEAIKKIEWEDKCLAEQRAFELEKLKLQTQNPSASYFGDKPSFRILFSKDAPLSVDDSPLEINSSSCPTNSIPTDNTIQECKSPYAAPVILVPKSNGTVRLCIDYHKLNAITIPDKYPLPLMDVLLHDAKSTAFISTLDLKSGYHQVEINPVDQDKTAFVCPFGTFRYKRMPFGLRNAPPCMRAD